MLPQNPTAQEVSEHLLDLTGHALMARHCVVAQFRNPDEVGATHETRLISDGLLIEEPFPTLSVLVRDAAGVWKIRSSSYYLPADSIYRAALDP